MKHSDTIVAAATSAGGALSIVRVSGPEAIATADSLFKPAKGRGLAHRKGFSIAYGEIMDGNEVVDDVLVSVFRAPSSYTGEDMVEISCHGSPYITRRIIELLIRSGTRAADAGEFTLRAFMAGKMDLSQAEAVADMISSHDRATHVMAVTQMRGGYSEELALLRGELLRLASLLELELDFSEEDVQFADREALTSLIEKIEGKLSALADSFALGNVLKSGIGVAIAGSPNVGKSTLLNALLKEDRAMVSDIAGTTRDAIEESVTIDGVLYRFTDTAGIRASADVLEQMGIERTYRSIEKASVILYLFDAASGIGAEEIISTVSSLPLREGQKLCIVLNKCDAAADCGRLINELHAAGYCERTEMESHDADSYGRPESEPQRAGDFVRPGSELQGTSGYRRPGKELQDAYCYRLLDNEPQGAGDFGRSVSELQGTGDFGRSVSELQGTGSYKQRENELRTTVVNRRLQIESQDTDGCEPPTNDANDMADCGGPEGELQDADGYKLLDNEPQSAGDFGRPGSELQGTGGYRQPENELRTTVINRRLQIESQDTDGCELPTNDANDMADCGGPEGELQDADGYRLLDNEPQGAGHCGQPGDELRGVGYDVISISAKYGDNIGEVTDYLSSLVDSESVFRGDTVVSNTRHYEALLKSRESLDCARAGLKNGLTADLLAQDTRQALYWLGTITGEITTDEILTEIFSNFCIGK